MATATSPLPLSRVKHQPIQRLSSGYRGLDWVYGSSCQPNGTWAWGLPVGGISLWAGAAGCGKSRLAICVAAAVSRSDQQVLYCQNEVSANQFKAWVTRQNADQNNFFLADGDTIEDIIQSAQQIQPALLVIDSISMIRNIERHTYARTAILMLKAAAERLGCHVILVGHLNARGRIRGGTTIPHLADTVCNLEKGDLFGWLWLTIVDKHRYGIPGRSAVFHHDADGLTFLLVTDDPSEWYHRVDLDPKTGRERLRSTSEGRGWLGRLLGRNG